MKLHCFMCASPLFPDDGVRDRKTHEHYFEQSHAFANQEGVEFTVIQNGCWFSTKNVNVIRNPILKSLAYNWLVCDANCQGTYWLFFPEDCLVKPKGWKEIKHHMEKSKT
jgi:hypothetical protein